MATVCSVLTSNGSLCKCSLCLMTYNIPKLLPCRHAFCQKCIEDYADKERKGSTNNIFFCPLCKARIAVDEATTIARFVEELPRDNFLSRLVKIKRATDNLSKCDICKQESNGTCEWCLDCVDIICNSCTRLHLQQEITQKHVVVTLQEMKNLPLSSVMEKTKIVLCEIHRKNQVNHFCIDCHKPVCEICRNELHVGCKQCVSIQDVSLNRDKDLHTLIGKVEILLKSIDTINGIDETYKQLDDTVSQTRENIKFLTDTICSKVREAEKMILQKLEDMTDTARAAAKKTVLPQSQNLESIKKSSIWIQSMLLYGSDIEILSSMNRIVEDVGFVEENIHELKANSSPSARIHFVVDEHVDRFVKEFSSLGHLQYEGGLSDEGLSNWGVACNNNDDLIVTDSKNRRIQKFSPQGKLIDHIVLNEHPFDVACWGRDEVSVTTSNNEILFLATRGSLRLRRRIKTEKQYEGIAFSSRCDFIAVTCLTNRCVDLIGFKGEPMKSFQFDKNGASLFREPRYLCATRDRKIIVTDVGQDCVICLDEEGETMYTHKPSGAQILRKPQGVCADRMGNVFIADNANNRIQLILTDGTFQRFVLTRENGLDRPVAIGLTSANRLITVQNDGMVKLFTYA